MKLAVVNVSDTITEAQAREAVRAIAAQVREDFFPSRGLSGWGTYADVRLIDREIASTQADAIVYLADDSSQPGVLGYHDIDAAGKPYGYVFRALSDRLGDPWSVTLSHEVLELIQDPTASEYALGPHPQRARGEVFHWLEVCDAVEAQHYMRGNVAVSNFVTPLYFTEHEETARPTNFLGRPLRSFGVAPGGYVGFYDPSTGQDETVFADARAEDRAAIKTAYHGKRRALRRLVRPRAEAHR